MKTKESRFQVHDELTAPEGSVPILKGALAVAEHQGSEYALSTLQRTGRDAGLGMDEIALAREFDSYDEKEAALLRFVKAVLQSDGPPKRHFQEEAREA